MSLRDPRQSETVWLARSIIPGFRAGDRAATAMITCGGSVVALGTRRQALRWKRAGARVIDLSNVVITPGLIDSHTHLLYWALNQCEVVDLRDARRPVDLERAFRASRAQRAARGESDWVVGARLSARVFGDRFPTAAELDRYVPDRPLYVRSHDGHTVCLNTRALQVARIRKTTRDPVGGRIARDDRGAPTGVLHERAIELVSDPVQQLARSEDGGAMARVDRALDGACRALRMMGIVAVHTMDGPESLRAMQRRRSRDSRGQGAEVRVTHAIPLAMLDHATALGLRAGLGDDWLRVAAVKIFSDGALGSRTALMFEAYPGTKGDYGQAVVAGAELREAVCRAASAGWPVWVHAIGDRAVSESLDAIAAARKVEPTPLQHRIEHAQCVRPRDVARMARLGVIASMQPCHLPGDIANANAAWPRARRNAYPFRRMLERGVTLAFGSDMPIEEPAPWRGLWGATYRAEWGADAHGIWFPEQRTTMREALYAFTRGAAMSVGDEAGGILRPGAGADMALWSDDPRRTRSRECAALAALGSIVGGGDPIWAK